MSSQTVWEESFLFIFLLSDMSLNSTTFFSSSRKPTAVYKILSLLLSPRSVHTAENLFLSFFSQCFSTNGYLIAKHWDNLEDMWFSKIKIDCFHLNSFLVCVHITILHSSVSVQILLGVSFSLNHMCTYFHIFVLAL